MAGKFLIASNNRATVNALKKALQAERHRVVTAPNGLVVVDTALDSKPNAIFLGVALRGLSGLDAARALRSLAPTANVPIIFLAQNRAEAKQAAHARVPLTDCLIAPFDLAEVKTHALAGWHTGEHIAAVRPARTENDWLLAILDPLTRLYHRRYLLHRLAYEAKRSARYKTSLAVLLVDVDNLKAINRAHGILTGDSVLIETGQLLLAMLRRAEIVGRNETQDFMIIAPQTNLSGARDLARRIRQTIGAHHFVLKELDLHVTVSVGVAATSGGDVADNLALLGRAQVALTRAKRRGKDRVEVG
ncbi:MAG: diguanylate cyclase [Chloroflexi bacterium]|nr:diguanylate cyclase [Chloroflexota bacterium]